MTMAGVLVPLLVVQAVSLSTPPPPLHRRSSRAPDDSCGATALSVASLRTCYRDAPLGVDNATAPLLSWQLRAVDTHGDPCANVTQSAYRIQAASGVEALLQEQDSGTQRLLWDSGWVAGSAFVVPYTGVLLSRQVVVWRVQVRDQAGAQSNWSVPAFFEMALLTPADWGSASWLAATLDTPSTNSCALYQQAPAPLFRSTAPLRRAADATVVRARAYVAGLGYYALFVNGHRAGGPKLGLEPAWTAFDKAHPVQHLQRDRAGAGRWRASSGGRGSGQRLVAPHAAVGECARAADAPRGRRLTPDFCPAAGDLFQRWVQPDRLVRAARVELRRLVNPFQQHLPGRR